ncbi:Transmembrane emp24 domain-containing protein p24delta3 [Capsicum chinense]|nr:Transmembrane emp24 domain-containing protein p24delta3 [Capsicum chinense]
MVVCLLHKGEAIWLSLPASGTKRVSEELHNNVVVLADYVVISDDHVHPTPTISARVTSPNGNALHHKENTTHSQFAFTTTEAGNYLTCFWADNPGSGSLSVNIDWKTGIAAKDWESVARKEKIEGLELELRKLELAVEAIHENLIYLKSRELEMRSSRDIEQSKVKIELKNPKRIDEEAKGDAQQGEVDLANAKKDVVSPCLKPTPNCAPPFPQWLKKKMKMLDLINFSPCSRTSRSISLR